MRYAIGEINFSSWLHVLRIESENSCIESENSSIEPENSSIESENSSIESI